MSEKILFVDDDANILAALHRQLRKQFTIETSTDASEALASLEANGPYAIIVSDMRMPGMDGVQFLSQVRQLAPDSVRIMLTGNADQQTAMDAVNEGAIFRFLTKPCSTEVLARVLIAGIAHYRLVTAEKELLEKTLRGALKVLSDILGLINPLAFSRSSRIQHVTRALAVQLHLENIWQLEIAAMLSQIGCVTLMPQTLESIYAGQRLPPDEAQRYANHPAVAMKLLSSIPRLEAVAQIIGRQNERFEPNVHPASVQERDPVAAGAQVLKVAIQFERLIGRGLAPQEAVASFIQDPSDCDPAIVKCLEQINLPEAEMELRAVPVRDLTTQMILDEDVRAKNGSLIVTKGQTITYALLERLNNFCSNGAIAGQLRVRVPRLKNDIRVNGR